MSTVLFVIACAVLILIVLAKLPGVEHFVKPIVGLLFTLLQSIVENIWAWGIYLFKTLWYSHSDFLKHLVLSEDAIDPSVKMKKEADSG